MRRLFGGLVVAVVLAGVLIAVQNILIDGYCQIFWWDPFCLIFA